MKDHFIWVFWFVVGVTAFGAGLSIYSIYLDPSNIPNVLTFWLSMGVATCIGYIVGNSVDKTKKPGDPSASSSVDLTFTAASDKTNEA